MEYFDMRKMSVNLWRNAAGETREICTFPPEKRDFYWRASIASIAANGEFSLFPGMERIVTLLEGGEMLLESADRFNHTLKPFQPFAFAADQVVKAKLTAGQMSMDFNIMTRLDVCKAKVRIADQKYNRLAIQKLCKGKKVLDCFTHTGSFALNAGVAGASEVLGVDASELAVLQAKENAALNGLEERVCFLCQDVFELLPELEKNGEKFDVVILDPPAFTKSRNSIKNAVKGYREINLRGMKLVKDGGYLATCSCSHFMDPELFAKTIREAAGNVHKRLRQVEYRTQAADHPILWAAQESYYLKFYIFQVCDEK